MKWQFRQQCCGRCCTALCQDSVGDVVASAMFISLNRQVESSRRLFVTTTEQRDPELSYNDTGSIASKWERLQHRLQLHHAFFSFRLLHQQPQSTVLAASTHSTIAIRQKHHNSCRTSNTTALRQQAVADISPAPHSCHTNTN